MKSFVFAASLLAASTATAQTAAPAKPAAPSILDQAINTPGANWAAYGTGQTSKMVKTTGVPGDGAMRVAVAAKGSNPWDVGALSPIQKPIAAGDVIMVAAYLRAPALAEGATTPIPSLGVTESTAPYGVVASAPAAIGKDWKLYYASGKASRAFAPGSVQVAVQLAGAKHVVELGPVFVIDFGPNHDLAKLPKN